MVYAGETPWHGLGAQIEPWLPVEDAIRAAGVDWTVELLPVYGCNPVDPASGDPLQHVTYDQIDGYQRTVRSSDNHTLGIVKSRYTPIQNAQGFLWFNDLIEARLAYIESMGSLKGGRIVWGLARVNMDAVSPISGDELRPYLLVSNSHDGTKAGRLGFTEVRVICWNTLSAAHDSDTSDLIRVLHNGKAEEKIDLFREAVLGLYSGLEDRATVYAKLATMPVTFGNLERYTCAVLNIKPKDERKRTPKAIELVRDHFITEVDRVGMNWWAAFNAITAYLSHDSGRSADGRYAELWFGVGAKKLTAALTIAVAMSGV